MTRWLDDDELAAWIRLVAVVELLPGVLDSQLRRDSGLTHYEYFVLATLSSAPSRTLRMTDLAGRTHATLPRLSHVVSRMEGRALVERTAAPGDRRVSNIVLTATGWETLVAAAPGHVETVRHHVLDALTREQVEQLADITAAVLTRLDPGAVMGASMLPPRSAPTTAAALP